MSGLMTHSPSDAAAYVVNNPSTLFNPHPVVQRLPLFDGHYCLVIDDFLCEPRALVDFAQEHRQAFRYDSDNYFPGVEINMGRQFALALEQFFMLQLRPYFHARRQLGVACRMSMTTLQPPQLHPLQRLCHRDAESSPPGLGIAAAVVYLFDRPELGGTSFYKPKFGVDDTRQLLTDLEHASTQTCNEKLQTQPNYLHASNAYFDLMRTVEAKWNRALFYEGTIFHAAQVAQPELLIDDPRTARLALNGFLRFKKQAL